MDNIMNGTLGVLNVFRKRNQQRRPNSKAGQGVAQSLVGAPANKKAGGKVLRAMGGALLGGPALGRMGGGKSQSEGQAVGGYPGFSPVHVGDCPDHKPLARADGKKTMAELHVEMTRERAGFCPKDDVCLSPQALNSVSMHEVTDAYHAQFCHENDGVTLSSSAQQALGGQ